MVKVKKLVALDLFPSVRTTLINEVPKELENKQWAPSWRRMCKVMLRNDYWCKGLGQTQPKSDAYLKFKEIKAKRKIAESMQ